MQREKDYPKNHADDRQDKPEMMQGVYGGPECFAQSGPPMVFQAVYAGPDFYVQRNMPALGAPVPIPAPEPRLPVDAQDNSRCACCGMQLMKNAKFCTECGTPVPGENA